MIPYVRDDPRFVEMLNYVNRKQLDNGGYVPESVWRVFKDWSFGQKKESSPWLSYKIALINSRIN
jgi:hypothetical protein